jgi:putative methyltransferase
MNENLKRYQIKNVRLKCMDFLQTNVEKYDRVEYILLDVPCSGSGMTSRVKFGDTSLEFEKDAKRLWKLEALQCKLLLHAMTFTGVQRIVYSTCSIHKEENENVVRYVLNNCDAKFKLVNLFEQEKSFARGICESESDRDQLNLNYCLRLTFNDNFTNGFFIACFELNKEATNQQDSQESAAGGEI